MTVAHQLCVHHKDESTLRRLPRAPAVNTISSNKQQQRLIIDNCKFTKALGGHQESLRKCISQQWKQTPNLSLKTVD